MLVRLSRWSSFATQFRDPKRPRASPVIAYRWIAMFGHATALASITTMSAMSAALATGTILMAVPGVSNSSAHDADAMHCNLRRWRAAGGLRSLYNTLS